MTDEHQPEVLESGVAVLAEDEPSWDDGPFPVRGVALPEGITTNGNAEGEQVYWPADTVATVAEHVEGAKLTDPSKGEVYEHDPETAIERPQPSPETIIGEVTGAKYEPGVGVLYEGEVDDPEIAKRIDRGRVEVSPTIFRTLGDHDDERDARVPDAIVGVRDLSVVAKGQAEGNSIEPATAAMSALSASALAAAFDEDTTTGAEPPTGTDGSGDDGPDGGSGQSTADRTNPETMSDEDTLTDDQRELLSAAETLDDPTVIHGEGIVEAEHVEVLEAAVGREEPAIVEQSEYETLQEDLGEAKSVFAEVLAERSGMNAETLSALPWSDLRGEFTDDEGDLDAETLVQTPETGQPDNDGTGDGPSDDEIAERVEQINRKLSTLGTALPRDRREELEAEACELADVDDFETAKAEVL